MTREELESALRAKGAARIDIPEGWLPLVIELHKRLEAIDPRYKVAQCKQKYGGLRYYMSFVYGMDDDMPSADERNAMWKLVEEYEQKSFRICQDCGEEGHLHRKRGWLRTACTAHGAK